MSGSSCSGNYICSGKAPSRPLSHMKVQWEMKAKGRRGTGPRRDFQPSPGTSFLCVQRGHAMYVWDSVE